MLSAFAPFAPFIAAKTEPSGLAVLLQDTTTEWQGGQDAKQKPEQNTTKGASVQGSREGGLDLKKILTGILGFMCMCRYVSM